MEEKDLRARGGELPSAKPVSYMGEAIPGGTARTEMVHDIARRHE